MIDFTAIGDAISGILAGEWPERTIYRDVCPADFRRPSFFLSCDTADPQREMLLTNVTTKYLLEIFDEIDEYYVTSSERLMAVQARVLSLFSSEDLAVEDRHITVTPKAEGREPDKAFVSFTATWMDCDDEDEEVLPEMETFHVNTYLESNPQPDADLEEGSD